MQIKRVFVEKKEGFNGEAIRLQAELMENLGLESLKQVRILNRYDLSGVSEEELASAVVNVLSEPNMDIVYLEGPDFLGNQVFAYEYLPGQYDQRADSAAQSIQLLTEGDKPLVRFATVVALAGVNAKEAEQVKDYLINPVDSREASLDVPESIAIASEEPDDVIRLSGFIEKSKEEIELLQEDLGLAMSKEDLLFCQSYFREEGRDPSITEIKVIDTYWSDHCRHTTFMTVLDEITFPESVYGEKLKETYKDYLDVRADVYGEREKDICLMDLAVIAMKKLKKDGILNNLDESDEINACSIEVPVEIDGETVPYLVMFKNETHNHPTEIEPFGGAATCLGGAIRDPLSGRSYVYQAMRVTGSADPRVSIEETIAGKLPQRKICQEAAHGYSSYGNQIGLATGKVEEIYHPGYMAKRMEVGAVVGAAPKENVVREKPVDGDLVVLVGGRTGRDGCGGATGSSKEHDEESILTCGAEVQKGNPPTERKIQRLFRNANCSKLIKKCNDFGAGGVCVAIGELTDGLVLNLDKVPKKYEGLDGTELAISESQERMAVVLAPADVAKFEEYCAEENLESSVVATVTDEPRLIMNWRNDTIVDLKRSFLDTNGVKQHINVAIEDIKKADYFKSDESFTAETWKKTWVERLSELNTGSQKGLVERFDSTIGAGSVLMPFGGNFAATPSEGMVAKIPLDAGSTDDATAMSFGFDPYLSSESPYLGAMYAVAHSVVKSVCMGVDYRDIRLSFQEYFERLGDSPLKWGKPLAALLGAYKAQRELAVAAIGGKDSMSGTFKDLHVPPTLISFVCAPVKASKVVSAELRTVGAKLYYLPLPKKGDAGLAHEIDFTTLKENLSSLNGLMQAGNIEAAMSVGAGGLAETLSKMAFGNRLGIEYEAKLSLLNERSLGGIVLSTVSDLSEHFAGRLQSIGTVLEDRVIRIGGEELFLGEVYQANSKVLNKVYPQTSTANVPKARQLSYLKRSERTPAVNIGKPRVFIPAFPGTNCEIDSKRAFELAGADASVQIFRNLSKEDIHESILRMEKEIRQSNIVMIPGGFSAGDEPEGSAKFIAAVFKNPRIKEAVSDLIENRDGLMLGICNGFQALVKLGLLPYGSIRELSDTDPTLTFNTLGRHVACYVETRVSSVLSPWMANVKVGEKHKIAISHGEGRFVADEQLLKTLIDSGQVSTQYVDHLGMATHRAPFNPNGSVMAIEGISSADGRILGKMGHSERTGEDIARNIPGAKDQQLFAAGVKYFSL
jgi:phosphoribosylformylglycinamidine synthase